MVRTFLPLSFPSSVARLFRLIVAHWNLKGKRRLSFSSLEKKSLRKKKLNTDDDFYMRQALFEAEKAFSQDEVPVGAILVHDGKIIAKAHNLVEQSYSASRHAEMICMERGAEHLKNWRLTGCTLYSTLEPCSMCAGAMFSFRIDRLVWAAPDLRLGANGSFLDLFSEKHPMHTISVTSHILEEEAAEMMREFFRQKRG